MKISAVTAGMLQDVAELAATAVLVKMGKLMPYLSQKQAYDTYGRRLVERWVDEGLVKLIKDGTGNAKIRINRMQIESVAKVSNRPSYGLLDE